MLEDKAEDREEAPREGRQTEGPFLPQPNPGERESGTPVCAAQLTGPRVSPGSGLVTFSLVQPLTSRLGTRAYGAE